MAQAETLRASPVIPQIEGRATALLLAREGASLGLRADGGGDAVRGERAMGFACVAFQQAAQARAETYAPGFGLIWIFNPPIPGTRRSRVPGTHEHDG